MTRIRVLRDQAYSNLLLSLAGQSERVQEILDAERQTPIEAGTIVEDVTIDQFGKARYLKPGSDEPWYSAQGDYEVLND